MSGRRIWLFGKLPRHGDFVARNLDAAMQSTWDAWLSEGMAAVRAALGADFDAAYEAAPPWRFVIGPGPFGADWRVGALTPSVDAAGRRFPVIMAVDGLSAEDALRDGAGLAGAMDEAIRDAFGGQLTADEALQAGVARAGAAQQEAPIAGEAWWTEDGACLPPSTAGCSAGDLLVRLWAPAAEHTA